MESLHHVRRVVCQDDGGVALAVDAGPNVVLVVFAVDVHAGERHRGAVGNHDLVGMRLAVERAGERRPVGHDDRMARPNERRGDVRQVAVPSVVRRRDALHLQPSRVGQRHGVILAEARQAFGLVARGALLARGDGPFAGILRAALHLHTVGGGGLRPGARRRCHEQREQKK